MNPRRFLLAYAATGVVFLSLDALWLSGMAERLYRPAIGHLMRAQFALAPALAFYALYLLGIVVFAVAPALADGRRWGALGRGALLGLISYATYDLTNQATLAGWPWAVTVADLCWGSFATGIAALASTALVERLR